MDFRGEAEFPRGGSVGPAVPDLPSPGHGFQMWNPSVGDQAIWATEDEYRSWNASPPSEIQSNLNHKVGGGIASRPGTEPPNKKLRNNSQSVDSISNRSKAIGKMFYKTKLCCKFRAGVCPYITNCNFAHGIEELRRPPPNWQEIVAAAHEGEGDISASEQREEHQIPTISPSDLRGDHTQRSHKGRHCKKFYTEEGCPYGDNCTFLHDEQSRSRESVAISVSPTVGGSISGLNQKPSNWKTRICNKWETTGNCPFGSKCHFAHGLAELHRYGGGLVDTESQDSSLSSESKQSIVLAAKTTEAVPPPPPSSAPSHHIGLGVPSQLRFSSVMIQQPLPSAPVQRPLQRSKGPDKISKIYGDWIDDIE